MPSASPITAVPLLRRADRHRMPNLPHLRVPTDPHNLLEPANRHVPMKAATTLLLVLLLLGTAAIVVENQKVLDPLAQFREPDGRLHIPGSALTPEIQHLLFSGNDLRPYYNLTFPLLGRSPYPTMDVVPVRVETPNLNVYVHPTQRPATWGGAIGHLLHEWFPPVDWEAVGAEIQASLREGLRWLFGLVIRSARADTVSVDSTTVATSGYVDTCTTTQTANPGDNAVLVMLSERGNTPYATVTYGSIGLSLIPNTAVSNGTNARTEMWFYQGAIPAGPQTMTATLSGGTQQRQACATVLLRGVATASPTTGGTTAIGGAANPSIAISPGSGELGFAVLATRSAPGPIAPTAVTGTGAVATSLYGISPTRCTSGGGSTLCGAGADLPNPGTAITWTQAAATWAVSAVRVTPAPNCGAGGGNCYRIGAAGQWNNTANWSNTSGGASCGCAPSATDNAIFNATPTGTTSLAAATTIASIDMTNFTGTLDTVSGSNWSLTVNGDFSVQGTFLAQNSTVTVVGNVTILTAATVVNLGGSTWTVSGSWTNSSTSASWAAGTSAVTIRDAASATLTFAALAGPSNEFNNLTLDASVTSSITYTMAANGLRIGGTLTLRNSTASAVGSTILTTSASNLSITAGGLTLSTLGSLTANGSAITVNGNVNVSAANGYLTMNTSSWTVAGTWTDASTSASWSPGTASVTFTSASGGTMTFAGANLPGNEFYNVAFASSSASAQTFTMATRALRWGGTLTVSDAASTTQLATASLGLTGGALSVGNNGILTANASIMSVSGVSMTGGASGTITLTTSSLTNSGNWDTSGAGSVFTKGTSTVTMSGVSNIAILNASNNLHNLTISAAGTVTQTGLVDVSGTLSVNAGAILASSTFTLTAAALAANLAGGITAGASGTKTIGGNVSIGATGYFSFGTATWNFNGSWTNASTSASWNAGTGTVIFRAAASQTMTFKPSGTEFPNLTFDTTASAGITYTMATNPLTCGGALTVQNSVGGATGYVVLDSSASNLALTAGALTLGSFGRLNSRASTATINGNVGIGTANAYITNTGGAWTVSGSWTNLTTSGSWSFAASMLFRSGSGQTMTFKAAPTEFGGAVTFDTTLAAGITYSMATNALTLSGLLTVQNTAASPTGNTILTTSGSSLGITAGSVTIGTRGTLTANGSTISVGGNWTVTAANATFAAGTSTVTFTATATITMTQAFNNLTVGAGTSTLAANTTVNATLTVSSGTLAKSTFTLSTANLALSGGTLTSTSGNATVSGNVNVSAAASYVSFGSESWTITGTWTNSSTSASWGSGTGTVIFNAGAARTMTFGNLSVPEFNNVQFSPTAAATFTMATNGLRWAGTLTLNNNATLSTSNLALTGGSLVVNNGGTLTAGTSTVGVANVTMTGGTSGTITASGSWAVTGSWDTSGVGSTFTGTTSIVTMSGAGVTVRILNSSNGFGALTISGTVSAASAITTAGLVTVSGTFNTTGANFGLTVGGGLTVSGASGILRTNASTVSVIGNVNVTNAAGYITSTAGGSWTASGSWTSSSTSASWSFLAPITFNSSASQTMTLGNPGLEFGGNVTFNSGVATVTFTMAVNSLDVGGTLTIAGGAGTTTLNTSGSNLAINAATLNVNAGGSLTANGSTITVTSMDAHLGAFTAGASTVVVNVSGGSVNISQNVNNLTVNPTVSTTFAGSLAWTGTLTLTNAGTIAFGASSLTSSGAATMTFVSATITMSTGNWDTSSATTFTATGSTVTFSGTGSLRIGAAASLAALTISGGTRTLQSQLTTAGLLTLSGGTLAKGTNALTANAGLTMSGGTLTSTSGAVNITGNVTISVAASYIAFGSEAWSVTGSWTNSSTSASWSIGTATVTFTSSSAQTMTFAALPANAPEFNDVTFNSGASTVTFTIATNPLVWSGTLTVQGGSGTTILDTGDFNLTGGDLAIGDAGQLTANASTVSVSNVTMTGGTSGMILLTTGVWTVSGNWDTSGAGSTLTAGTSTVIFTGTSTTLTLAPGQMFNDLIVRGTVSVSSTVTATATLTVDNGAILTKTGQSIAFNRLIENGTGSIADGTVSVVNLAVTNSDLANITTISAFSVWTIDTEYSWADSSTIGTSTITFTIGGNTSGYRFNVMKDAILFTSGMVDGSGQVIFAMLSSDPVIDVLILSPCASSRYWVGGTGDWSQIAHWAPSSGGAGGCAVPNASNPVFLDANSGGGIATLDVNAVLASLDTTGWAGTIAIGAFDFAVSGNVTHAAGTITIGDSSSSGLTSTGDLTVSGTAVLDGFGAASVVSIAGNTQVSSATAYFRMGSGTWTFGGSWSNSSMSSSWAAGTGTVLFNSSSSQVMTFADLASSEFFNVIFAASATGGTVTFTMTTNALRWSNTLTVQDTAGSTTELATGDVPLTGGSLIVGDSGVLTANASSVSLIDVAMNGATSGTITLTSGSWTVSGSWDTSGAGSTFTGGTGSVTFSGTGQTVMIRDSSNGFYTLVISGTVTQSGAIDVRGNLSITGTLTTSGNDITGGANLAISGGGALIVTTASISVAGLTMNDLSANILSLTSGSISASGSWDTSGAASVFTAGTSTVRLTGISTTLRLGASQAFATLIISGSISQVSSVTAVSLTVSAGGLAKGTQPLTVGGNLTLAGGYLSSISGDVSIIGDVVISSPSSYIAFGSGAWTVSGSWTNDSTSPLWSAGSGTVTFNASSPQMMTFAGANLSGREFNAVVFNSGSFTIAFSMTARGLVANAITIQGSPGATTLDTSASDLPITATTLTVASGGALTANGSIITVGSMDTSAGTFAVGTSTVVVDTSGGSIRIPQVLHNLMVSPGISATFTSDLAWSAILTLTSAAATFEGDMASVGAATLLFDSSTISIAGSWDTTSSTLVTSTGSSVTFTGLGQTIALGAGQSFSTLAISGTIALASDLIAADLTVNPSATLTKTGYSIAFNRLAANGTVVDGSEDVSNLTVTNSDAAALLTISIFSTWSDGSSYAWTHTSSGTSQITWTIGGNTVGYLYTVTKDGSPYTDGTVNGSGEVAFTMLGSDPDMHVTVAPPLVVVPPSSEWWRTPYLLAIPPIGLLVVVAMFVQRQRWRPTKAFLVDERGQLLREFTLDPACDVTYDQAVRAGALDAREKDIQVSKYHARTVRGDALAIVLLARGPVGLHEVEFAREVLVNVQDKFEGRVQERLEEARAAELSLDERTRQIGATEEDLRTRVQAQEAATASLVEAQGKVAADTEALQTKEVNLVEREEAVETNRASLEELGRRLEDERSAIGSRTAEVAAREEEADRLHEDLSDRESHLLPKEQILAQRESDLAVKEADLAQRAEALAAEENAFAAEEKALAAKREELEAKARELGELARTTDEKFQETELRRHATDARWEEIQKKESEVAKEIQSLESLKQNLGPREQAVLDREKEVGGRMEDLGKREARLQEQTDLVAAKALEIQQERESLEERESALAQGRASLDQAHAELSRDRADLDAKIVAFEDDCKGRRGALDAEGQALDEQRSKLVRDRGDFESMRGEKSQQIAVKEIEIEAREQSLADKEAAIRSEAEANAKTLADIAAQEEAIEIERSKQDKARAELENRKASLGALEKELDARGTKLREEESRKADELRTWQTTLESEQALLKEQRETFDKEMLDLRESWAARMLRVEQKEQELADREAKIQTDVDWVARSESDVSKREKALVEDRKALGATKADLERLEKDLEQRTLEVESRERAAREEAAARSVELQRRSDAMAISEADLARRKTQMEQELAARAQRLQEAEDEIRTRGQALDTRAADLDGHEARLTNALQALREDEGRLVRERGDLSGLSKQLEARQLELTQVKDRLDTEGVRLQAEREAMQQATAAKEAELHSERERLERESTSLQEKLGAKAKEMVALEKALGAREEELRSEETDLEARVRQIESREQRAEHQLTELRTRAEAIERQEQELKARASKFTETVQGFETEAAAKRKEWEHLQTNLKSQEAQIAASAESRQAEIAKRMEGLAQREQSLAAMSTQLQLERSRLDAEAKKLTAERSEAEESAKRGQKRAAELKSMEDELLEARQAFEAEKASWSGRRSEELKQLEATRDAAAEQTQQSERLIEDAQRRAYVATEAERSLKRQMDEMAARQAQLESRRAEAEKAERDLQSQLAEFHAASEKFAARENELNARARDLDAAQAKLLAADRANASAAEELKARRGALDQEADRLANISSDLDRRRGEEDARRASIDGKLEEVVKREQTLATELQRADNLMEDLAHKEAALVARVKTADSRDAELAERESVLAQRDRELLEGMQTLERMRQEHAVKGTKLEDEIRAAAATREEVAAIRAEAERIKIQADAMQAEVSKNMRFLQKKALDVLDREEKLRVREAAIEEETKSLEVRSEIVDSKEKTLEAEREELAAKMEKMKAENEKLKGRLSESHPPSVPAAEIEEWRRDIDNRVKIIQKKALELLDREEKLRKKEEELQALEERLAPKEPAQ